MNSPITRRDALKSLGAAALAAPMVLRAHAAAPSETVYHASFGAEGMAFEDIRSLTASKNVKLVAVAEVDQSKLEPKSKKLFPDVKVYSELSACCSIKEKNLDSVNVSTPDHMHGSIAMSAMQRGKHVYGQKPLTQTIYEARQMAKTAADKKVITQMGIQIHSHEVHRTVVKIVHDGAIGKIKEVHSWSGKHWGDRNPRPNREDKVPAGLDWDLWLGVAADRPFIGDNYYHPGNWRKRLDFGTGTFGDMGCHILDPVFSSLALTSPLSFQADGDGPTDDQASGIALPREIRLPRHQIRRGEVRIALVSRRFPAHATKVQKADRQAQAERPGLDLHRREGGPLLAVHREPDSASRGKVQGLQVRDAAGPEPLSAVRGGCARQRQDIGPVFIRGPAHGNGAAWLPRDPVSQDAAYVGCREHENRRAQWCEQVCPAQAAQRLGSRRTVSGGMRDRFARWAWECAVRFFGPVFAWEATRIGRRLSTFIVRWIYLLILAGVMGMFFFTSLQSLHARDGPVSLSALARFSENFFWTYTVTQFIVIAALVPALTAGAITSEKERKTLGFLLVTSLSAKEIVFGKLGARVAELGMLILAGMPLLSILQFVGGIDPRLIFLAAGMTISTVISLSAISAAASVQMARTREAVLVAYVIPFAYTYGSSLGFDVAGRSSAVEFFAAGNPIVAADRLGASLDRDRMMEIAARYVAFQVIVAVLGFGFAVMRLRRSAEPRSASVGRARGSLGRFILWICNRRTEAREHRPLGDDPVGWRELYVEPGSGGGLLRRLFMVAIVAAIALPFLDILLQQGGWLTFQERVKIWVCGSTGGLGVLMLLRATVRGASSVAAERDRDTWMTLIATPLTTAEILRGKWMGCVWGQRDMMYLLAGVWITGVLTNSVNPFFLALTALGLGVYLNAFAWVGIRLSIAAKNARVAIAWAVPQALILAGGFWIVIGCCLFGVALGGAGEGVAHISSFFAGATPALVCGWYTVSLILRL